MDYNTFDQILNKYRLNEEPAFRDVKVAISPIPDEYHALGLYYPDAYKGYNVEPGTIWIPPESDEETALHELGHRFGHYYDNDLSESLAEKFRLNRGAIVAKLEALEPESDSSTAVMVAGVIAVSIAIAAAMKNRRK